jgi:hypothetical protein
MKRFLLLTTSSVLAFFVALALRNVAASPGSTSRAISLAYSGSLPDADGIGRDVSFTGQLNGANVTGTVSVAGNIMSITATVAQDGSVTGNVVLADGTSLGTFRGTLASNNSMAIAYALGGRTGIATLPVGATILQQTAR